MARSMVVINARDGACRSYFMYNFVFDNLYYSFLFPLFDKL